MIPIKRGNLIINCKNNQYVFTNTESWDGDWKKNYPHLKGLDYIDIFNPSIWSHDVANGLPFTYDLVSSGGIFTLYADQDSTNEQIKMAKAEIRHKQDVVSLRVMKLTEATT